MIEIRSANKADIPSIISLYSAGSGRTLDEGRLDGYISSLPCAVAHELTELVGFGFCVSFAPDIIELGNIFIAHSARSKGIGSGLLQAIEGQAAGKFHSIILSNSMHYRGVKDKRPATNFYVNNGYENIWSTGTTNIFAKKLRPAD